MQHVPARPLIYEFSRDVEPRCCIGSGETIRVESEDALSGQIRRPGDRRDKASVPFSNPVAGPIVVNGAEPGLETPTRRWGMANCRRPVWRWRRIRQ